MLPETTPRTYTPMSAFLANRMWTPRVIVKISVVSIHLFRQTFPRHKSYGGGVLQPLSTRMRTRTTYTRTTHTRTHTHTHTHTHYAHILWQPGAPMSFRDDDLPANATVPRRKPQRTVEASGNNGLTGNVPRTALCTGGQSTAN